MDELYSKDDAPRKVNLNTEEPAAIDPYYEYTKALKKMPKYMLHKQLNNKLNDNEIRKLKLLNKMREKKIKL